MLPLLFLAILAAAAGQTLTPPPDYVNRIAALEESRRAHPQDFRVLDALAGSYTMGAEYDKAVRVLEEMRGMQPENSGLNSAWRATIPGAGIRGARLPSTKFICEPCRGTGRRPSS